MRRKTMLAAIGIAMASAVSAQYVPATINYQGRLTDNTPAQTPVNATVNMRFEIWDVPSGGGTLLWFEPSAGTVAVTVTGGVFNVMLGAASPLSGSVFNNKDRWLQIIANGETLSPRQKISSIAYANVSNDSYFLRGLPPSSYQLYTNNTCPANQYLTSIAGTGATTCAPATVTAVADSALTANVALLNRDPQFFTGINHFNANVGIGNVLIPGERLEVAGADATARIHNTNDTLGAFAGDTYASLQLGLYNPTGTANSGVPANTKRSFFGIDAATGRVGSLSNNFGAPVFRNVLDDGSGFLTTQGGVGIGTPTPLYGLDVAAAAGNTHARFGTSNPLFLISNYPNVGFNAYFNGGWKYGSTNAAGVIAFDPAAGNFSLQTAPSGAADSAAPLGTRLTVGGNGTVTIPSPGVLSIGVHLVTCNPASTGNRCSCPGGEVALTGGGSAPPGASITQTIMVTGGANNTWQLNCGIATCLDMFVLCARLAP